MNHQAILSPFGMKNVGGNRFGLAPTGFLRSEPFGCEFRAERLRPNVAQIA